MRKPMGSSYYTDMGTLGMKDSVFVFIYGYLPGTEYGGPVTSIFNFSEHFGDRYDIRIICSNHDANSKEKYKGISDGWNTVGKASVMYLDEKEYSAERFTELMRPFPVKLVYLTGVFSYFLNHAAIKAARRLSIPTIIATRGEICKNVLAMKSYKKLPYLYLMRKLGEYKGVRFQATSEEEIQQLAHYLGIDKSRVFLLPNIHSKSYKKDRLEKEAGSARMLYISRIHPKKNLKDVIIAAQHVTGAMQLDIYGPVEDKQYWKECCEEIEKVPRNVKISYCGPLNMEDAKKTYCNYHAFTFPTLTENYGHVIVEAMLAGCPVILSRGTTPWDDLDDRGGIVCELHDIPMLTAALNRIIKADQNRFDGIRERLEAYAQEKLRMNELLKGYQDMIDRASKR